MSLLQVAGAVAGFAFGGPSGAAIGSSIGAGLNSIINPETIEGPRLDDLEVQMSSYGAPVPHDWGVNRHAGTVIWPKNLELKEASQTESAKGGPETTTYSYSCSIAVLICEGPIAGVRRIWANKKLVYDVSEGNTGKTKDPAIGGLRFYLGTEDQAVDPLIEATDGPSPAYLGYAYCVFEDLELADFANRPPQFEFEVITEGQASQQPPTLLGTGGATLLYTDPLTQEQTLWSVSGNSIYVYGLPDETLVQTIDMGRLTTSITQMGSMIWVGHSESGSTEAGRAASAINPSTYQVEDSTMFGYQGAVSLLGTVVSYGDTLWAFVNEGIGGGALKYPANTMSSIQVPNYVYQALEMPDLGLAALTGNGGWLVVASLAADSALATLYVPDWGGASGHRVVRDVERNCLYWAAVGRPDVYRVSLDSYALDKLIEVPGVQGLHYNSADDTIYVDLDTGALNAYSPQSGALSATIAGAGVLRNGRYGNSIDVGSSEFYYVGETGAEPGLWRVNLKGALAPAKIPLWQIVRDICTMKDGLPSSDIDVTALTPLVDGYLLSRQMTRRAAIEALVPIYQFDAVENGGKLQFVMRGGAVAATIDMEDRAARDFGGDLPDSLSIVRGQDLELPYEVEMEYPDIDADHLVGAQYSRRITKDTKQKVNMQTAVVMTAEKAKQVTAINLYEAWLQTSFKWATTRKFSHLLPTDVVELPTKEALYRGRITSKREQPNGIIEWEAKAEAVDVYTQSGAGAAPTNYVSQSIFTPGRTVLELMDIPLVRDQDAGKGFPVAMAGTSASWPGAQLYKSSDNGTNYGALFSQSGAAVIGTAATKLGDFTGGDQFDEGNALTVKVGAGSQLVSYSEAQLLDGTSAFALGVNGRWEIIQYRTATLTAPQTYELTGLLRGRRGTEWATGTHQAGDHFILLNGGGIQFYDPGAADANVQRLYKAPAFRATLSSAAAVPFTDKLVRLRPYSVANLKVEDTGNSHLITWSHRSILGGGWRDGGDVPLDATFVAFDVSILKMDGTLVKTYSVTNEFFDYTDAQAAADFGGAPGDFKIRVAQRNSDYGQGIGVTIATSDDAKVYDAPPIYTGGGGVTPGDPAPDPAPDPGTPAADEWTFEARLDELLFQPDISYYGNFMHATPTHVFLWAGLNWIFKPSGAYFEANPNVYVFDRATKTFAVIDNGQVGANYGFESNAGTVGDIHYYVDGRPPYGTAVLGVRDVVRNDLTNPAAPTRSVYKSANAMVGTFHTRAKTNIGRMVSGKIWFPSSGSVFDPTANTWAAMPLPPVACRYRPILGSIGSKLYFLGGTSSPVDPYEDVNPGPVQNAPRDETTYKKEVWVYDTVAGTWVRKADLPYAIAYQMVRLQTANDPNYYATFNVEGVGGKLYVFDSNGQILVYDEAGDQWISKPNQISYRMAVNTSVLDGSIWMSTHIGISKPYGVQKANQDLDSLSGGYLTEYDLAQRLIFRYTPGNDAGAPASGLRDVSSYDRPVALSATGTTSSVQKKYGTQSLATDGTAGSGATVPASADFEFSSSQQFTIEGSICFSSNTQGYATLVSRATNSSLDHGFALFKAGGALIFRFYTNGADMNISGGFAPSVGQWYHLAVDRDANGTIRLYVDGVVIGSGNFPYAFQASPADLGIGYMPNGADWTHDGYIDEVRISSVARYAGAFAPPSAAFAPDASTLFLCHMEVA